MSHRQHTTLPRLSSSRSHATANLKQSSGHQNTVTHASNPLPYPPPIVAGRYRDIEFAFRRPSDADTYNYGPSTNPKRQIVDGREVVFPLVGYGPPAPQDVLSPLKRLSIDGNIPPEVVKQEADTRQQTLPAIKEESYHHRTRTASVPHSSSTPPFRNPLTEPFSVPSRDLYKCPRTPERRRPQGGSLNHSPFKQHEHIPTPTLSPVASQVFGDLTTPWYYMVPYIRIPEVGPMPRCTSRLCLLHEPALGSIHRKAEGATVGHYEWMLAPKPMDNLIDSASRVYFHSREEPIRNRRLPGIGIRDILRHSDLLVDGEKPIPRLLMREKSITFIVQSNGLKDKLVEIAMQCSHGVLTHRALAYNLAYHFQVFFDSQKEKGYVWHDYPVIRSTSRIRLVSLYKVDTTSRHWYAEILVGREVKKDDPLGHDNGEYYR